MFETITTRRQAKLRRFIAGLLSLVMAFMCLPVNALAHYWDPQTDPMEIGTPNTVWRPVSNDPDGRLTDPSGFANQFSGDFNKFSTWLLGGDGAMTINGIPQNGLSSSNPSGVFCIGLFIKILLLCDWATNNVCSTDNIDENGDGTPDGFREYNLFSSNATVNTENMWPQVREQLSSIMELIKSNSAFKQDTFIFESGREDASTYLSGLTSRSEWTNLEKLCKQDSVPKGSSEFSYLAQQVYFLYFKNGMAQALANGVLTQEGDWAAITGVSSTTGNSTDIYKAVVAKLTTAESGTTTTTVPGGEGGVTQIVTDNYDFPPTIDENNSLIIGDTAIRHSSGFAWVDDWYGTAIDDPLSESYADYLVSVHVPTESGSTLRRIVSLPSNTYSLSAAGSMPATIISSYHVGVKDVYVAVGYDWALAAAESTDPSFNRENVKARLSLDYNSTGSYATLTNWLGQYDTKSDVTLQYCTAPHTGNPVADAWIDQFNAQLPSIVSELRLEYLSAAGEEWSPYLHVGTVDTGDVTVNDSTDMYQALSSGVAASNSVTGINPDGEVVTMPDSVGTSGVKTAQLYTAYNNSPGLQNYMDTYNDIVTYVETLFHVHYMDDDRDQARKYNAYYRGRLSDIRDHILSNHELIDDILDGPHQSELLTITGNETNQDMSGDPDEEVESAGDSALRLISNCDFGEDYLIKCVDGDDAQKVLTVIGYNALAAGVVYDPFISREGNDSYMAVLMDALDGYATSEDTKGKVERFLHQALTRKKPLYVMDGTRDSWQQYSDVQTAPSGNYRFAYIADVLQGDVNKTRAYCVMKGGMQPSTVDGDTWVYSQGAPRESEGGGRTDNDVTYGGTPAGSTTTATASEMSAPVMFTSGTVEGMFKGNNAGSADGYAATVGGLTTVLLHNAAQDAKSNDYIQNADKYMLFMNGLGDIVLADGTVILPAIANPRIYTYDEVQYSVDGSTTPWGLVAGIAAGTATGVFIVVTIAASGGASIPVWIGVAAGAGAGAGASQLIENGYQNSQDFFYGESQSSSEVVMQSYDTKCAYYPYTAAFMNHYPSTYINTEEKLTVLNSNDKGKYVIGVDESGDTLARRIAGFNNRTQVNLQYSGGGVTVAFTQALSFNVYDTEKVIGTMLPFYHGDDGDFFSNANLAKKFDFYMVKVTAYNSNDQAFFPLEDSNDSALQEDYLQRAGPLLTSAKRFITIRTPTAESTEAFSGFDVSLYITEMAGQGLMGTQYSETLQKNYQISYDELVQDTGNRLLTFLVQLVESAVDTLGNIDGVLAIKNGYENTFFNMLVSFIQEFYALIAVVLLVIVAVKFLRGHYNMIFVLFIGAMCFCGFEVYANWMPTMVPNAYNFAVNDAVEQIVWNTVAVSAESYSETYRDSSRKDATTGEPKPYTATMTLYKMSRQDMQDMAARLGTSYKELKKGTIYYLDESAGIFVQGDAIKISIDRLLVNNSMRGLHQSQWEQLSQEFTESDDFITPVMTDSAMIANPYSVQLTSPYVSLEAYYMPYNEIERAFLIQLNKFASIFRMEHNVFSYDKGLYKDAFLFNCYTNSGIFTAPGNGEVLQENVRIGSIVSRYTNPDDAMKNFIFLMYGNDTEGRDSALFPVPEDWLGVAAVFRSPSENFKDSLWGRAMQRKGWYDDNWNIINPDKLNDLIYYMNTQTKQFVIANSDQLNFCSDENAIKIVSMYATTTFTHYTSEFGGWLYPNYVNAADITLKDALYGSMTTLKDRNFSYDGTVVNTVASSLGVFGVLFILLITVFACVFVFVMTYLVPILYALFGAIIVFKLINNSNSVGLVKGYIKVTGVTCLLYFIFSLSMRLVEVGGYAWYGYLGCALLMFLCCYFLFWVVLSVLQNVGELGNDVLGQNLLRGLDHITHGAVRRLTASNFMAQRMNRGYGPRDMMPYGRSAYQYGRGYGVDSRDYVRGNRSRYRYGSSFSAIDSVSEYGRDSEYEERGFHMPFFRKREQYRYKSGFRK